MMPLVLKNVKGPKLLNEFIYLPSILYKKYPNFVPPLYKDEEDFHNPSKNSNLQSSDVIRVIAYKSGKIAGRIMGIIHHPWNKNANQKSARFYQFDCIDDRETASALLGYIEQWAKSLGMDQMIGSFGFSDKDPQGIQVDGFDYPPVIASVSHPPYIAKLVSEYGYVKFKDCVSYKVSMAESVPEVYSNMHKRILRNNSLTLLEFSSRSSLKPFFKPVMNLMNEGYKNIFGFIPMSESDIQKMADQYLSFLDPGLIKIVVNESKEPVAFVIAMANISKGIKQANGRLFPFGFIKILIAMKQSKQLDLLLGAVSEAYRGRGLTSMLGVSLIETARNKGMKIMDSHLILEENQLMRGEVEKIGGILHKRYRIFTKML